MADHARAAAHIAFGHRPAAGIGNCSAHMLRAHMRTGCIAQPAVISFRHHRQREDVRAAQLVAVLHQLVAHHAHLMRIGDCNRRVQQAKLRHIVGAGHLTITVEGVHGRKGVVAPDVSGARQDYGNSGARNTRLVHHNGGMAHQHTGHIGDRIVGARRKLPNLNSKLTQSYTFHKYATVIIGSIQRP